MDEWHDYIKRFYRSSPHEQERAWAQLTPEQRKAFRAAYDAGFHSDHCTSAEPELELTYAEAADAEAAARKRRIRVAVLAVGLPAFVVILLVTMASMETESTRSSYSYRPPRSYTSPSNTSAAHSDDLRQAREFLADLPSACSASTMSVQGDGAVLIRIRCPGRLDGEVKIKDGIVRDIK